MKIQEFSDLYNVTPHTLRHYEKIGLLVPEYTKNEYRNYSYKHVQTMNVIRDLRYFDVSLSRIAKYLREKNLGKTKVALHHGIDYLQETIDQAEMKKRLLMERLHTITEVETSVKYQPYLMKYPTRGIIKSNSIISDAAIDLKLKTLHKSFESLLNALNRNLFGSVLCNENEQTCYQVFYFCNKELADALQQGEHLPEGDYLCYNFTGAYT